MIKSIWNRLKQLRWRNKIILGLVIIVVLFFIFRGKGKSVSIAYQTVRRNDISSKVNASGILSGKTVVQLHFNQAGKLNYLAVANGSIVKAGQVIASLDSTAANAAYQEAVNNRRNTQAAVDAEHDADKNNGAAETFAQKSTRTAAEVANDNAYNVMLAAGQALKDTTLFSPISGIIVAQGNLSVGQNITPTDLIAQVVDFSQKDFNATVDESDIGQVKLGQDAIVTLNAYGDTQFNSKVVEIAAETKTDSTGSITVDVKVEVDDPRIATIYGLNGQANIITQSKQSVLTISQDDLIDDTHVYIKSQNSNVKGQKIEKREIKTGIKSDTDVEVISGLNEGDQVVTNPQAVK